MTRSRAAMSLVEANWEIYSLLKDGVKVTVTDSDGEGETVEDLKVIDWENIENNDSFWCRSYQLLARCTPADRTQSALSTVCRWC